MSAALKSYVPRPTPTRLKRAAKSLSSEVRSTQDAVAFLPPVEEQAKQISQPVPLSPTTHRYLQTLSKLQVVSSVLASALVGLALLSYGVSVYVDRQLNQANRELSQLQRSEQQLTTANEVLKRHVAQQAESPTIDLEPPSPQHVIFLRPAHQRSQPSSPSSGQLPKLPTGHFRPIGY